MLDEADKDWIAARYVKKDDCTETRRDVDRKFSNDDTRIKLFQQQMATWSKLFWLIASATVGQFIVSLFEMIGGK